MKRFIMVLFAVLASFSFVDTISAQTRVRVDDGVYLVRYGKTSVLEDEKNQRSISIEIAQDGIDQRNKEKVYKVVCGKWTKRVVKKALKTAVDEGIRAAAPSHGMSLGVSAIAAAADWIYDDACEYFEKKL